MVNASTKMKFSEAATQMRERDLNQEYPKIVDKFIEKYGNPDLSKPVREEEILLRLHKVNNRYENPAQPFTLSPSPSATHPLFINNQESNEYFSSSSDSLKVHDYFHEITGFPASIRGENQQLVFDTTFSQLMKNDLSPGRVYAFFDNSNDALKIEMYRLKFNREKVLLKCFIIALEEELKLSNIYNLVEKLENIDEKLGEKEDEILGTSHAYNLISDEPEQESNRYMNVKNFDNKSPLNDLEEYELRYLFALLEIGNDRNEFDLSKCPSFKNVLDKFNSLPDDEKYKIDMITESEILSDTEINNIKAYALYVATKILTKASGNIAQKAKESNSSIGEITDKYPPLDTYFFLNYVQVSEDKKSIEDLGITKYYEFSKNLEDWQKQNPEKDFLNLLTEKLEAIKPQTKSQP